MAREWHKSSAGNMKPRRDSELPSEEVREEAGGWEAQRRPRTLSGYLRRVGVCVGSVW